MAEAEQDESADADDGEREQFAWASQTPTTRIAGEVAGLIYAGNLSDTVEQNDTSFGVVLRDPTVVNGTLFVNEQKDDDGTMEDAVDEDSTVPTDYRVADPTDEDANIVKGALSTEEKSTVDGDRANVYEEADGFDEDEIIVWYNGMSGQRIGRTLDFNGLPFARFTDDGYLVKGLMQPADGWRGANSDKRRQMARNGKAPRVARAPILRFRVDDDGNLSDEGSREVLIDVSRYQGGRTYEAHVFDAAAFADEHGNHSADFDSDDEAELEWVYDENADDVLDQAEYAMSPYTGDGWQDEPAGYESPRTGTGDFTVDSEVPDDEEIEEQYDEFADMVVGEMEGNEALHGQTPADAFRGGIEGLIGRNSEAFHVPPESDTIRQAVYERIDWLDVDDLE